MPSFTDKFEDPESGVSQSLLDTSLQVPYFQKGLQDSDDLGSDGVAKHRRAPVGKKCLGRPPAYHSSSFASLSSQASSVRSEGLALDEKDRSVKPADEDPQSSLFNQVREWLRYEQAKQNARKMNPPVQVDGAASDDDAVPVEPVASDSDASPSLDRLEKILARHAAPRDGNAGPSCPVRRPTRRRVKGLRRGSASDSDYQESESGVPSVDAVLDNSSLTYSAADADENVMGARSQDSENWLNFKREIVRLAHTMRIKGWRRLPIEDAGDIDVVRLSGALTNAVYVVTPPKNIPPKSESTTTSLVPRKPLQKLLLRIYGPQADHLIDRDNELLILRRLARKNIGPRVLGTFNNGRFEEYFEARTLTPRDLRVPETSNHIAKRMRELHQGIELLREEVEGGPLVFKNWDKWVDRCEQVTNWLDKELQSQHNDIKAQSEPWRRRGFVCGVQWPVFRKAVDSYRTWLEASCGGTQGIKQQLVFAHNDTQYGNLLRMEPKGESPLLLPANEHKQLVVIDFEYASANTPGFEFANHFTEWCYNYHDPERPWACNNKAYPTPEEQRRFITAYLSHRPAPSASPTLRGTPGVPVPSFRLDGPSDSNSLAQEAEKDGEDRQEVELQHLMCQQRLWRVINSAQWVAWGIVQAKVPGMEAGIAADAGKDSNGTVTPSEPKGQEDVEADGFDYLAYAQDRAMFFWADLLAMKLADEAELPRELVEHVKTRIIEY